MKLKKEDKEDPMNLVIERAAAAAYRDLKLNPIAVIVGMQIFQGNYLDAGLPYWKKTPSKQRDQTYLLRDPGTHSGIFYNDVTQKAQFIVGKGYWDEADKDCYSEKADEGIKEFRELGYDDGKK